jgi:hypothetical protein
MASARRMRITRDGGCVTLQDRVAPYWLLGVFLLTGGVLAIAMPFGLATNSARLELWERLASVIIGLGASWGALWWLRRSPASRVGLDLTRSRISLVRLGLSGRERRQLAFRDLTGVEVESGTDSEGGTVWRPAVRLRSGEQVLLSQLWSHDRREVEEVVATVAGICRLPGLAHTTAERRTSDALQVLAQPRRASRQTSCLRSDNRRYTSRYPPGAHHGSRRGRQPGSGRLG